MGTTKGGKQMEESIRELLALLRGYMEEMATLRTRVNETLRRLTELLAE